MRDPVTGKWNIFGINLPDRGITERYTNWQANPLAVQAFGAPSSVPSSSNGMQSLPGGTNYNLGPNSVRSNQVLGASTVNDPVSSINGGVTGVGSVNTGGTNTGGNQVAGGGNIDFTKYLADLATARSYRENGLRTIQTLLDSVNKFRDRNKTLYGNADQEITNQAEGQLGQNATTGQSLAGKANAIGRNLGLSQRMSNSSSLLGNLQKMQGGVLASKGENQRSNDALFQERNDQAQTQEDTLNNSRTALDTGYNDIVNSAGANYGQRLADVQARAEALAAMNPMNSSSLSSFSPTVGAGVTNTLNGLFSGGAGNTTADAGSQNAYNPTQISDYLKKYLGAYRG